MASLSPELRLMVDYLDEVNGQDAYSNEAAALGKLRAEEYLALPVGMAVPIIAPDTVGSESVHNEFAYELLAQVYALNKLRAPDGEDPIRYGLLRMEAVKMGWYSGQKEVVRVAPLADAVATMLTDLQTVRGADVLPTARLAAFLLPLAAEHTFRTMGHHYLSGAAAEYEERYRRTLRSCIAETVPAFMRPATLYHHALHWVSPARSRAVLLAQLETTRIPEALRLRANAAPAGCALVTTTAAVVSAMQAGNLFDAVATAGGYDLTPVLEAAELVRSDAPRFHKLPQAFGVAPASDADRKIVENAKMIAVMFAPVAQGFIDATLQTAALGRAKVLLKHAEQNPVLRKRASTYFRDVTRSKAKNPEGLFATTITVLATAED